MGSILRVLNADAEHTAAQGTVDANRILQAGNNYAATTIAAAQTSVRDANNRGAQAQADAQTTVRDANNRAELSYTQAKQVLQNQGNHTADVIAEAQRVVQGTRNDAVAAKSSMDLWAESAANADKLDATGKQITGISEQISAQLDQASTGRTWARLDAATALGANVAAAAAAGVGGSSVEDYNATIARKQAFMEADQDASLQAGLKNAARSQGDALKAGVASLDNSVHIGEMDNSAIIAQHDNTVYTASQDYTPIFANIDYSVYTPKLDYTKYLDAPKMSSFQQIATLAAAAGATYFGGPAAGDAVASASLSMYDYSNGNAGRAQTEAASALSGFNSGLKTYRAGATSTTSGQAWGAQFHI